MNPSIDQQPPTALQLWNGLLRNILKHKLFSNKIKGAVIPIKTALTRTNDAIYAAEQFEIFKHRIIVDGINGNLEKARAYVVEMEAKLAATTWIRFAKRRAINEEIELAIVQRQTYQECLMIVVNTGPPTEMKPKGHVDPEAHAVAMNAMNSEVAHGIGDLQNDAKEVVMTPNLDA